ncbi:MAG: hypothetical protein LBR85_03205 [Oscillospiraceae bacterium]|jgi:hypothetical protein|nr:hypothetical protein [Oscillospiraceae bacterium]
MSGDLQKLTALQAELKQILTVVALQMAVTQHVFADQLPKARQILHQLNAIRAQTDISPGELPEAAEQYP